MFFVGDAPDLLVRKNIHLRVQHCSLAMLPKKGQEDVQFIPAGRVYVVIRDFHTSNLCLRLSSTCVERPLSSFLL